MFQARTRVCQQQGRRTTARAPGRQRRHGALGKHRITGITYARHTHHSLTQGEPMLGFIVFGLVVGVLARIIKPGKQNLSLLATLGLGLVGSVIGGTVASLLGTGDILELNIIGSVVAVIAAVGLVGTAEQLTSGGESD